MGRLEGQALGRRRPLGRQHDGVEPAARAGPNAAAEESRQSASLHAIIGAVAGQRVEGARYGQDAGPEEGAAVLPQGPAGRAPRQAAGQLRFGPSIYFQQCVRRSE